MSLRINIVFFFFLSLLFYLTFKTWMFIQKKKKKRRGKEKEEGAYDSVEVCTEKQNRERKAQKYENGELAMEENYSFY
jgi:NADH:ubiquinone oxidoreductase subunit 3 (subunit A)